jgi:uncharacterized protein YgiM (DUF1202 family)
MKKTILLCILVLFAFSVFAQQNTAKYSVTSDALNIRKGPGMGYNVLGTKHQGNILDVFEITGDWAKISFNNSYAPFALKFV